MLRMNISGPQEWVPVRDHIKGILRTNVVLASYEDVRMSYPTSKPPLSVANEVEIKPVVVRPLRETAECFAFDQMALNCSR